MVLPLVRNGHILPNEQQPTNYLLAYVDSLLDAASRLINGAPSPDDDQMIRTNEGMVRTSGDVKAANIHLNTARDVLHVLQSREGWRESGDGGYK
jgi:hypothetical protein